VFLEQGKDPDAFVRFHVRRLEALRRAGHVERIDEDHWRIPENLPERGIAYDARDRGKDFSVRVLSTLDLDAQIGSDGATWLDRELTARNPVPLVRSGFGLDVDNALDKRAAQLVSMGHANRDTMSRTITFSRDLVATLERQEVARVGNEMAAARGLTLRPRTARQLCRRHAPRLGPSCQRALRHDRRWPRLPTRALATDARQSHRPAHQRRRARRRRHRVEF
jgi:hypothetical protein